MPIYEYHCQKCDDYFDVEQRMVDDPLTIHETCGGRVDKVFSSAGIVFKGSGFHKTDARAVATKRAKKDGTTNTNKESKENLSSTNSETAITKKDSNDQKGVKDKSAKASTPAKSSDS